MIAAMPADCNGENGVIHHIAAPISVAPAAPPTKPSTVFEGLTTGAILVFPNSLPNTYCSTSLICTTRIR